MMTTKYRYVGVGSNLSKESKRIIIVSVILASLLGLVKNNREENKDEK